MTGESGNDTVRGGLGNDTYLVGRGYHGETIEENDTIAGNTDVLQFAASVAADQLWFSRDGDDLNVNIDSQVTQLVQAMASFSLPSNYATTLTPVIAANWQ